MDDKEWNKEWEKEWNKEWNMMSEFGQFVTYLGFTVWIGIIALDKLARKRKSILVKEDKKWLLSFCPRFFATKLNGAKGEKERISDDLLKAWELVRKYGEHLPAFMAKDIWRVQSYLRQLKSEMEEE